VTTPQAGIVITLTEIYAEVRDMAKTVGRVDTTLNDFRKEVTTQLQDHETRIRADEANRWPRATLGLYATVAAGFGAVAALFIIR